MSDEDRGIGPIPNSLAVFGVIIVITVGFLLVSSGSGTEFKVSNLAVDSSGVGSGEVITASVKVANVGEKSGTHLVEIKVDGVVENSKEVTLDAGENTTAHFEVKKSERKSYEVSVGDLTESLAMPEPLPYSFTNENYGLSISYPEGWNLDNRQFMGLYMVLITENISEDNQVKAKVQVSTGNLGLPSLENVRDQITTSIENNENVTLLSDLEDVTIDGIPGIDLSARTTTAQGVYRVRQIVLVSENSQYFINSTVMDNSYENFKSDIESIIDSFSTV